MGEAEADADALYGAYAAYPYAYGLGYAAYSYAGIPNPVHAVAATPAGLTHSSNVGICTNYLGAAVPCGKKKREAEAEADPALLYGAFGYPYAYGAYPYAGVAAPTPPLATLLPTLVLELSTPLWWESAPTTLGLRSLAKWIILAIAFVNHLITLTVVGGNEPQPFVHS